MTQTSLWQTQQQDNQFAELCNALYERELAMLARLDTDNVRAIQGRLQSLAYYVQKAAHAMVNTDTPLTLDSQNATWSTKQSRNMPLTGQEPEIIAHWYLNQSLSLGLVVPVGVGDHIALDCIDRLDLDKARIRTNLHGWFELKHSDKSSELPKQGTIQKAQLLKPTKKVMMASCAGHTWCNNKPARPVMPTLRELLLSCSINWKNLKKPLVIANY